MNKLSALIGALRGSTTMKWLILAVSVVIIGSSIFYTNQLVSQVKERERDQVRLYARALEYMANEAETEVLFITEEIISKNNSIPTLLTDQNNVVIAYNNIDIETSWSKQKQRDYLMQELKAMQDEYLPIVITLVDHQTKEVFGKNYVYYRNSNLLSWLSVYPYIQLSVLAVFGFIAYLAFNYSKIAEQNRLWVGLSKETAHQLGTPLSSLIAWVEVLRDIPAMKEKGIVHELEKDIRKLNIIAERFSSIGSTPTLAVVNVVELVSNLVEYFKTRVSSKINFEIYFINNSIEAMAHAPLLEWVVENICKNSVDAITQEGTVAVKILRGSGQKVFIDISDTGKGMSPRLMTTVFNAGITTKKRGWGLGLTLAKRIVEHYHKGRIYVRFSQENVGTTFRIELQGCVNSEAGMA